VFRGGSWFDDAVLCRSAVRLPDDPAYRGDFLGFRLARLGPLPSNPFTLGAAKTPEMPADAVEQTQGFRPYEIFRDHFSDGATAPDMIYVPGGTFKMGDIEGDGDEDEKPVHEVSLDDFAIGRYPVTVGEYMRFVEDIRSHYPEWLEEGSEYHLTTGEEDHYRSAGVNPEESLQPVVGISWGDAAAYCEWLSSQTGGDYSLLTEAEWEYACRAGSDSNYSFGDDVGRLGEYAWYGENSGDNVPSVGQKQPNTWGLYDMHGNVWEWVRDWYGNYSEELQSNPSGPAGGSLRVIRGGGWFGDAENCRSACRDHFDPAGRGSSLGFRLARRV
jgi:formylglycine-generating enzyme required for sulfatase activity